MVLLNATQYRAYMRAPKISTVSSTVFFSGFFCFILFCFFKALFRLLLYYYYKECQIHFPSCIKLHITTFRIKIQGLPGDCEENLPTVMTVTYEHAKSISFYSLSVDLKATAHLLVI